MLNCLIGIINCDNKKIVDLKICLFFFNNFPKLKKFDIPSDPIQNLFFWNLKKESFWSTIGRRIRKKIIVNQSFLFENKNEKSEKKK